MMNTGVTVTGVPINKELSRAIRKLTLKKARAQHLLASSDTLMGDNIGAVSSILHTLIFLLSARGLLRPEDHNKYFLDSAFKVFQKLGY